jgi:hypothetical protein
LKTSIISSTSLGVAAIGKIVTGMVTMTAYFRTNRSLLDI